MPDSLCPTSTNLLGLSKPIIVVVGPTASGKSSLAQNLALELDGEVVSADSMQIYKGMDIGTAKLLPKEQLVAHFGFDLIDPGMPFSAALYQSYARTCLCDIDARGKLPILCGGTGFYIRATVDGYEFPAGEQTGNAVRDYYNAYVKEQGSLALWNLLNERDPESAQLIEPRDTKRVVRAFELLEDETSYAEQKRKLASIPQVVPALFIGLSVQPEILNKRIDERVDNMMNNGFLQEVEGLLQKGLRTGITAPQAIGYKELVSVIDGEQSLEEAVESIKIATHQYAKRQRTWFRKDGRIHWLEADEYDPVSLTAQSLAIIRNTGSFETI